MARDLGWATRGGWLETHTGGRFYPSPWVRQNLETRRHLPERAGASPFHFPPKTLSISPLVTYQLFPSF